MGSVDACTLSCVSLSKVDTRALFSKDGIDHILTNPESGILPLCVERPMDETLTRQVQLTLNEIQARIQSSALFVMASDAIEDNINPNYSINMQVYGSCEVSYKSGMSIPPEQLVFVLAPEHLVKYFHEAGFENV